MIKEKIQHTLMKMFPIIVVNRRADQLIKGRPTGIHPIKKHIFRRECQEILNTYENYKAKRRSKRKIQNSYSGKTQRRIEWLKDHL